MALTNKLAAIGDAIRRKNGATKKYTMSEMVTAIDALAIGATAQNYQDFLDWACVQTFNGRAFQNTPAVLTSITVSNATAFAGERAFYGNYSIESISLPKCTTISDLFAYNATALTTFSAPVLTTVGTSFLYGCKSLSSVSLPKVTTFGKGAFGNCSSLTKIELPAFESAGTSLCYSCSSLTAFVIKNTSKVATLPSSSNAFAGTPIKNGTGYIYVPDALVDTYKAALEWSNFAAQIKPLSELPTE